ncbi:MAG: malto-oligosyltrehalose trehalohydrolase [Chlamydiia bacterium]|nr:malto-oligosyltrehalose trehalohydrolase [Chlamydiia bacterium]
MPIVGAVNDKMQGTGFRVWAPLHDRVAVEVMGQTIPMTKDADGYHHVHVPEAKTGMDYFYVLEDGRKLPDPASRWQPHGVHGASRIYAPGRKYDDSWVPPPHAEWILYELHIGTFTKEGTFFSAIEKIPHLKDLGVNAVEVMPVAAFPGNRNWGYDGVFPFAVQESYGGPDAFETFIDACHRAGIAVILDVVYNHFGPEGCYFQEYGPYFTDHYRTPWGKAINYDGAYCDPVRDYILANVRYWIEEFHLDGLRLDAVHAIFDLGVHHILKEIQAAVPHAFIVAESDQNDPRLIKDYHLAAQWNDDFHHALRPLLTGDRSSYFADFGSIADVAKALSDGFVFDGQYSTFRKKCYGGPSKDFSGERLVFFIQNHDQIANASRGNRLAALVTKDQVKLAAMLLLAAPALPMLFMGEEWGARTRFDFFTDFPDKKLAKAVSEGRKKEYSSHNLGDEFFDPQDEKTFLHSKLDWRFDKDIYSFYQQMIALRRRHFTLEMCSKAETRVQYNESGWVAIDRKYAFCVVNLSEKKQRLPQPPADRQWTQAIAVGSDLGAPWSGSLYLSSEAIASAS